jgi:hypothetical protein
VAQEVEHQPSKHEALSSNSSAIQKKEENITKAAQNLYEDNLWNDAKQGLDKGNAVPDSSFQ